MDKLGVQRIYDSIRLQLANPNASGSFQSIELVKYEWDVVIALLAQELGVQSLIACELRKK